MLKESITYKDFDDKERTEILYFNISKTKLMDNIELKDEYDDVEKMIAGPSRELETHEIKKILDLVKRLLQLAYGVRDGDEFDQSPEVWERWTRTKAYDTFLYSLFENGAEKAVPFILNVLPEELRDDARKAIENGGAPKVALTDQPESESEKKFEHYTKEQLLAMSDEEFLELVPKSPLDMSKEQLQIAMQRKNAKDETAS